METGLLLETIGDRIKKLRESKHITQYRLGLDIGSSDTYVRKVEAGTKPGPDYLLKFAEKLETTTEYLLTGKIPPAQSSRREAKENVFKQVRELLKKLDKDEPEYTLEEIPTGSIPVLEDISAGSGIEPVDITAMPGIGTAPENTMSFRVKGFCLEPNIPDGTTLVIHKTQQPMNDNLVVVIMNGKGSVKRYKDDGAGHVTLQNNYGSYRPEDVKMIGVVIGIFPPGGVK